MLPQYVDVEAPSRWFVEEENRENSWIAVVLPTSTR